MNEFFIGEPAPYIKEFLISGGQAEDPNLTTPLTFTTEEANSTIYIRAMAPSFEDLNLEYKTCISNVESEWAPYVMSISGPKISLVSIGDWVSFRAGSGGNQTLSISTYEYLQFRMTGKIAASGNIQSLLDQTLTKMDVPACCYYRMFSGCSSLTKAPALPATTLAIDCYFYMFSGCTSLTQAPVLPATTLTAGCYEGMFSDCTSLTQAPALPATTLVERCYNTMFSNTKLTEFTLAATSTEVKRQSNLLVGLNTTITIHCGDGVTLTYTTSHASEAN